MGEAAPLIDTPAAPVPPGGEAAWFEGAGGFRLRAALFPAVGTPRGSVVLSGGRTEPIEKYFEVIAELRARGFTVLAHDWRGQGLSQRLLPQRLKGHAAGYRAFVADFTALITAYQDRLPKPWIAMGHSMGGCLTLLCLALGQKGFSGAVLSAPMLALLTGGIPRPIAVLLSGGLSALGAAANMVQGRADSPITSPFETNVLTHDRARYDRNQAQVEACPDLALGGPTWGWLDFAFRAIAELRSGTGVTRLDIPVTVVAAGQDKLVDITGQRLVTARIAKGRFVEIPGAYHEILQETDDIRTVFWGEFDALADQVAPRA
ncbi:alpha/beta fold hydrolase [Caulobacter sp. KR2-114]|uniref:alpha/beta fold hydrolase n=1 Tax=Caulobacter sp. KR2-114 TaxID=3400912 RepID=UPI003BFFAD04